MNAIRACAKAIANVALLEIDLKVVSRQLGRQSMPEGKRQIMTARPQLPDRAPRTKGAPTRPAGCLAWISPGAARGLPVRRPSAVLARKSLRSRMPTAG